MANRSKTPRAWQRMLSGRRLDLLDPSPVDVELEDIALGLARVARWNGQTFGEYPFSVAEHSLLVEKFTVGFEPELPARWRLAALLHDAPEYVIGDLISPFKAAVGVDYKAFEHRLMSAVHLHFGLPAEAPKTIEKLIKRADRASAYFEAIQLAGFSPEEAGKIFPKPRFKDPKLGRVKLKPLAPVEAEKKFVRKAEALLRQMALQDRWRKR